MNTVKPNHFKCYEATLSGKIDLPYLLEKIFFHRKDDFVGNKWNESPAKVAVTISIMEMGRSIEDIVAFPFIHENGEIRFQFTQGATRYVLSKIFENMSFRIIFIDLFNIGLQKIKSIFPDVKECYDYFKADLKYSRSHKAHKFKLKYKDIDEKESLMGYIQDIEKQYSEWLKTKPVLKFYYNNKLKWKWGLHESNGTIVYHIDNVVDAHRILLKHLDII